MLKQILDLSKVQLLNLFSINEIRYTKDKKKKQNFILLTCAYIFVALVAMGYVGGLAYGYHYLGIGDIVPMYLYTILSLVMFVLSFFKAGSVLFSMKSYDIMISLPVTKSAILVSRFVTMYVTNLLFSLIVLVPGLAVHIFFAKPGFGFYIISLLVILFAPLLPLTLASILGAGMKAISSRMKRRNLVEVLLTMVLVIVPLVWGTGMGTTMENMDVEAIKEMVSVLTEMLGSIFPPALWYHKALLGSFLHLVLLLGVPALIFVLFVWLLSLKFTDICAGLNATYAKQNYKVTTLKSGSALLALLKKEMKLYFSSSLYVSNTIVGYVLAVILSGAIAFLDMETLLKAMTTSGELPDMTTLLPIITKLLPFVVAMPLCMMTASACTISMEGKTFWQLQVLPVKTKEVYQAKLLWNLFLATPFYTISVILVLIGGKPSLSDALHYILLPLVLLIFSIVLGLAANLRFPNFTWDNEAQVVKQGASVLVTMLGGMISVIAPAVLGVVLQPASFTLYYFSVEALLLVITSVLYQFITKKELIAIPR
jgi:ABC-2 type transport system permease protein